MNPSNPLTTEQQEALAGLGLRDDQIPAFLRGDEVVYSLVTESQPGIAILQLAGGRLRSGVVEIRDPGGGIKSFARFRGYSRTLARLFGCSELELFGAAVINARLEEVLLGQGFERRTERCPDELGDEEMDILSRVFPVGGP